MLRKSMIALCALASVVAVAPNMALARGGGGGGGGGGSGGHAGGFGGGGFGGGSFGGSGFAGHTGGFGGGSFGNGFAHANIGAVPGGRFASGNFGRGNFGHGRFDHGRYFGLVAPLYWDYPDYAYNDSYYDNGSCYVVQRQVQTRYGWRTRPVQVCG